MCNWFKKLFGGKCCDHCECGQEAAPAAPQAPETAPAPEATPAPEAPAEPEASAEIPEQAQ
jgi:hypothetical protein